MLKRSLYIYYTITRGFYAFIPPSAVVVFFRFVFHRAVLQERAIFLFLSVHNSSFLPLSIFCLSYLMQSFLRASVRTYTVQTKLYNEHKQNRMIYIGNGDFSK